MDQLFSIKKSRLDLSSYKPNEADLVHFVPKLIGSPHVGQLKSVPTHRESQSFVLGFHGDVFYARIHPSGSFDEIPDTFDVTSVQMGMVLFAIALLGAKYYEGVLRKTMLYQ